ncbi:hypothetical protein EJ05DRAFT_481339 [Pseudovirgaria hyperparasitica]|uniref:Copper transport protein n=1 Tax=Pseudovirgaria hyperparasitica TaxID=470096 RepID=A0A6A6WHV8_9PEZI|nr:uncharacterized protein EJ05DRAFT_481339 [Pseudovirgaria hyperparasitica]KAF2762393.1 hypothetical protein EJ05DRAFT_481339 [Pseudovirgaria hyperparasitica]
MLSPRHGDDMDMDMDMSSMNMSSTMSGRMNASQMNMVFFSASTTPLFSSMWMPTSTGHYVGTCIFLIVLAFLYRASFTLKHVLEKKWRSVVVQRRYLLADTTAAKRVSMDSDAKEAVLTVDGVEERVRVVSQSSDDVQPWRFSVDLPRSVLVTVMVAVGYLLMLAVMTMNVGYFASILGGAFAGEVVFGRFLDFQTHH